MTFLENFERLTARLHTRKPILFWALIAAHVLVIWLFKYFPSQDGPMHLHTATVLGSYGKESSIFQDFYDLNHTTIPNWTIQFLLTGIMAFVPALTAEKILISLYIILFPLAFRYAIYCVNPNSLFLSFLAFPFILNLTLHMGFYNFVYSLPLFLFTVGYWIRYRGRLNFKRTVGLSLLSLVLYFTHLFSLATFYIAIGTCMAYWLARILLDRRKPGQQKLHLIKRNIFQTALPTCVALIPVSYLLFLFFNENSTGSTPPVWENSLWQNLRLERVLSLSPLASFSAIEIYLSTAFSVLIIGLIVYSFKLKIRKSRNKELNALAVVSIAYLAVYWLGPVQMSGSVTIKDRLVFYPFFAIILWLAIYSYPRYLKRAIQSIATALSIAFLTVHAATYGYFNQYLREYTSAKPLIRANSTALALTFRTEQAENLRDQDEPFIWRPNAAIRSWRINPFLNASGYLALNDPIVLLNNYQANSLAFPINFRQGLDPFKILQDEQAWRLNARHPKVDILAYSAMTGRSIDYVLIWMTNKRHLQHENTQAILQQLETAYDLIYVSPHNQFLKLYRLKTASDIP